VVSYSYTGHGCLGSMTSYSSLNLSTCGSSGGSSWEYCTSVLAAAPTALPSTDPTQAPSLVVSLAPSSSVPTLLFGMDDMGGQLVDDMSGQLMDDMAQPQDDDDDDGAAVASGAYVVREDFLWSSSSCVGVADRVSVTAVGMCFSHCSNCGSFKYVLRSRSAGSSSSSGGSGSGVDGGADGVVSGVGDAVAVVLYSYADDGCRTARSRQSIEKPRLGCASVGSGGMQQLSVSPSFPSLLGAQYYVSRYVVLLMMLIVMLAMLTMLLCVCAWCVCVCVWCGVDVDGNYVIAFFSLVRVDIELMMMWLADCLLVATGFCICTQPLLRCC